MAATFATPLTALLGCQHPIISAGMGGPARAELAAAVSEAGGFGLLGLCVESPTEIASQVAALRARTNRPFGVNLIPANTDPGLLAEELAACFEAQVPTLCFFWDVRPDIIGAAKQAGCQVLYQVGSLEDALLAEAAGADAVIVQGVEAGGHVRGTLPLAVLLPQVTRRLAVPVVASGGIADGRGLLAALAMGAAGVQCGTVFLASPESFAHDYHKQRIVAATAGDTVHCDLFAIGWPPDSPVRVLKSRLTEAPGQALWGNHPDRLPREVIGEELGRPILKYGTDSPLRTATGDYELFALYAGESAALVEAICPAGETVGRLMAEAEAALAELNAAQRG